jgi:hypothetical protein
VPELLAQAAGFDAYDWIGDGVKRGRATKYLQGDAVALEPPAAPGKGLVDNIFEEPLPALRLNKRAAPDDAAELLADRLPAIFASGIEGNERHG